jgi:hypothetical protein
VTRFTSSFVFVALLFALLCAPLLFSPGVNAYTYDEVTYHLPAVRQIQENWPHLDINADSLSATAPGYHYALATLSMVTGSHVLILRSATWMLSLGLLALLWRLFDPSLRPLAVAALLPLACSNFYVKSASWIVTDNPALLGMSATLCLLLFNPSRGRIWLGGLLAAATTFIRQLYVWLVLPVLASAALRLFNPRDRGFRMIDLAAALPACAVLALLVGSWGGLVPSKWLPATQAANASPLTSVCYLLAVFFILGVFYHLAFPSDDNSPTSLKTPAFAGAVIGLLLVVLSASDYNPQAGRWGGYLWAAAQSLPVIGGRSLVFILLTPAGAALLAVMITRLVRRTSWTVALPWIVSLAAWSASFLPNTQIFHRYYEPAILVFLILWTLLMARSGALARPVWLRILAVIQLILTLATAHYRVHLT